MTTATELRDAVVSVAAGEIGYTSGDYEWSKYGQGQTWRSPWTGPDWQGMYCNRFLSWCVDQAAGAVAARAAIGHQAGTPLPAGFAATWLQRAWFILGGRWVGFANAEPGDYVLFKLPGRQTNPTNHVGIVAGWHTRGKVLRVIEGNLARPGHGLATIGVWEHLRDITYVVGVYRPDWAAAAALMPTTKEKEITVSEADRIIDEIRKTTTVDVSKATAGHLFTGRTGAQPRDWFLNLLGNRIGRTDKRVMTLLTIVRSLAAGQTMTVAQVDALVAQADDIEDET